MAPEPTYYIQISDPEEPERWHTVARVEGRALADEVIRLAQGTYMRATVTTESHFSARALSRSHLRRAGVPPERLTILAGDGDDPAADLATRRESPPDAWMLEGTDLDRDLEPRCVGLSAAARLDDCDEFVDLG